MCDLTTLCSWKQQQIKQERADRTQKISNLKTEIALNGVLRPRIIASLDSLKTLPAKEALATYSSLVSKLKNDPSPEKPQTNAPNQPTYDVMLLHLLEQVSTEAKEQSKAGEEQEKVVERLAERLAFHNSQLDERTVECERTIGELEEEAKRKITSDDIHEGFSSGVRPAGGEQLPVRLSPLGADPAASPSRPIPGSTPTRSAPTTLMTRRNRWPRQRSRASRSSTPRPRCVRLRSTARMTTVQADLLCPLPQSSPSGSKAPAAVDPEDEELPDASPLALKFTTIPYLNFAQAFSFIQTNPSILVEQTTDSLLLEAFNAEIAGEKDRARRCVEKGLLVQYCRKLGKDGVRLFFQRCVFPQDVLCWRSQRGTDPPLLRCRPSTV